MHHHQHAPQHSERSLNNSQTSHTHTEFDGPSELEVRNSYPIAKRGPYRSEVTGQLTYTSDLVARPYWSSGAFADWQIDYNGYAVYFTQDEDCEDLNIVQGFTRVLSEQPPNLETDHPFDVRRLCSSEAPLYVTSGASGCTSHTDHSFTSSKTFATFLMPPCAGE